MTRERPHTQQEHGNNVTQHITDDSFIVIGAQGNQIPNEQQPGTYTPQFTSHPVPGHTAAYVEANPNSRITPDMQIDSPLDLSAASDAQELPSPTTDPTRPPEAIPSTSPLNTQTHSLHQALKDSGSR